MRHAELRRDVACEEPDAPDLRPGHRQIRLADPELSSKSEVGRGDELAADLAARKPVFSTTATARPGRASRIAADEPAGPPPMTIGIVVLIAAALAANTWLNGRRAASIELPPRPPAKARKARCR